jgi:hypothetical protein
MKKTWALIGISLLAICACSSVALLIYVITASPISPTTLSNQQPTFIVAAYDPPTLAPVPTVTPTPTLMPVSNPTTLAYVGPTAISYSSCLTAAEYKSRVGDIMNGFEAALTDFANYTDKAGKNSDIILDPSWQASVENDLKKLDELSYRAQALKPPRGFQSIDQQLKLATSESLAFTKDTRDGIYNLDVSSINKAIDHMHSMENYVGVMTDMVKKMPAKDMNDDTCP